VLTLRPADGRPLAAFRPGQHVGLRCGGAARSYSLIGPAAAAPQAYRIAVRHIAGGQVSGAVRRELRPGATVDLQAPTGSFLLPLRNEFPIVLIAGGIGITPFLSYLETLEGGSDEPQITLHYACRDAASRPFGARLEVLRQRLPNLTLITHLSRPASGDRCDRPGRLRVDDIDPALLRRRARFYICAPDAMRDGVRADLRARGVPDFEIFTERFRSPPPPVLDDLAPRRIDFARSGRTLVWSPDATSGAILATAERAGLALPSGCRVGQCESCLVPIKQGQVRHLTECPDLEDGQCLTCQAVPLTDLVLDA
jgi:ferredoxin-NADP reductase